MMFARTVQACLCVLNAGKGSSRLRIKSSGPWAGQTRRQNKRGDGRQTHTPEHHLEDRRPNEKEGKLGSKPRKGEQREAGNKLADEFSVPR